MTSKTEPRLLCYDLGEGVTAFSTTRHGGVSEGNYASFNINPYCGDSAASCWPTGSDCPPPTSSSPTRSTASSTAP